MNLNPAQLESKMGLKDVSPVTIALAALASYAGLGIAAGVAWPVWAMVLAAMVPWLPMLLFAIARQYGYSPWLALFALLTLAQVGHFLEHAVQMDQIHLLGLAGEQARGIFGALDIEWVHFVWNTWILVGIALVVGGLDVSPRRNPWLWLALLLAGWHELEHSYLIGGYLATGVAGAPGLLATGGALFGGLPLSRADLHFVYNLLETAPLVAAFLYQVAHSPRSSTGPVSVSSVKPEQDTASTAAVANVRMIT